MLVLVVRFVVPLIGSVECLKVVDVRYVTDELRVDAVALAQVLFEFAQDEYVVAQVALRLAGVGVVAMNGGMGGLLGPLRVVVEGREEVTVVLAGIPEVSASVEIACV